MKKQISLGIKKLRLIRFSLLLFVLTVAVGSAFGQQAAPPIPAEQKLYLADYEAPTATIRAGFIPYRAQLAWGEPLQVTFTVENLGANNFDFMFGGDYRGTGRHDRFKIAVTNASGDALLDPRVKSFFGGGILQPINLKTGQFFTNVINLTDFRAIDKPGIYTISCSFAFDEQWVNKEQTNLVVNSTFTLTILERTPERVAKVLDELVAKAQATHGQDLRETLMLIASFGKDDVVPRLARLTESGSVELRAAAIGSLPLIPTDASLDIVLARLKDSEATIRSAAAGSLGTMQKPRGVNALLDALPNEKSPVAEAIVLALGASKSDRAFPVITNTLDTGEIELQKTAINALVNFGGSNAVAALMQRINTNCFLLRYEIVLALAEKLHQPMQPGWLSPVLVGREQNHEWLDSIRLLRMYAGDQAVPSLLSYLDFDAAWSGRNWWILETGVKPCPHAPPVDYEHDPNSDGTPEQWQKNLRILQTLKPLASPIPVSAKRPKVSPVPYLVIDPPIEFTPSFKEIESGGVEINSGFLSLTLWRGGANLPYTISESYREIYKESGHFRSLPQNPKRCAELIITPDQVKALNDLLHRFAVKLCDSRVSDQKIGNLYNLLTFNSGYCPSSGDWSDLLRDYKEVPLSLREQAKVDLIDSVRVFSQNYHAGTVEFAKAAKQIFTPKQLEEILR